MPTHGGESAHKYGSQLALPQLAVAVPREGTCPSTRRWGIAWRCVALGARILFTAFWWTHLASEAVRSQTPRELRSPRGREASRQESVGVQRLTMLGPVCQQWLQDSSCRTRSRQQANCAPMCGGSRTPSKPFRPSCALLLRPAGGRSLATQSRRGHPKAGQVRRLGRSMAAAKPVVAGLMMPSACFESRLRLRRSREIARLTTKDV